MRRRRLLVVLVAAALLIAATFAFLTLGPQEPNIKGTSLRRWLVLVGLAQLEVDLAQIGPEAIPWLIRGLEGEQSRFDKFKVAGWRKLPRTLQLKWKNYYPIDPGTLRLQCAHSLKLFGAEATNAVPQLIRAARVTNDLATGSISLQALAEMASDSPQAMAALLGFLKDRDYPLRSQAVLALWNAELKPKEALPILLARLEECEPGSRENGAFNEMLAISRYGADGAAAGPLLVRYLTFGEGWGNALSALKGIGPGAAPAVSRLLNMLAAPDAAENKASLAQMKPSIFRIFGNVGPAASAALPVLTNGLHDASGVVRALAAAAIANVTGDYDFAVPLLVKELENRRWRTEDYSLSINLGLLGGIGLNQRQTAALLLGEIGPRATNALPNLKASLRSGDMWLPVFAAEAIWKISSDAEAILPCLIESATHTERHRRVLALRTLRAMGPAAKSAVPAIQAAMKIDMKTRHEAVEALKNIEGSNANSSGTTSR